VAYQNVILIDHLS